MKFIGIDIGTTAICGVLCEDGKIISLRNENSDAFINTCNEWEKIQDAEKIIYIAKRILNELIDEAQGDISAIGVTGQMHGILYYDVEGRAVSPLYTWQDRRGDLPYKSTTYAKHLGSFAGYGNVTDFYNRENGIVPRSAASYCTIHDYFVMHICENNEPLIHASDAASLGLYNAEKGCFEYPYSHMITEGFELAGSYRNIPVSVAIGDNQASVLATLDGEDELLVNVGTGSQVSLISEKIITAENIEARPYFNRKYLIVGSALCGGRAYSLLKDFYRSLLCAVGEDTEDIYAVMARIVGDTTESSLRVDTRFDGTRQNPAVRGSISNIGVDNFNPKELTVGVLFGIIEELYNMYTSIGIEKKKIVASGNGIRKNDTLKKITAHVFGKEVRVSECIEEAAMGAVKYAAEAVKGMKNENK